MPWGRHCTRCFPNARRCCCKRSLPGSRTHCFGAPSLAGLAAPANTPDDTITRLNAAPVKILQMPELCDKWKAAGMRPMLSTPEAFQQFACKDSRWWGDAVRVSNFKANEL